MHHVPSITQAVVFKQEEAEIQSTPKQKRAKLGRMNSVWEQSAHVLLPSFQNMVPNMRAMPMVKENLVAL